MKKLSKRFFAFFLAFAMTLAMVPAVFAKTQDGLSVELTTDKESYKIGEEAAVKVVAKNTSTKLISNVEIKIELPQGIKLKNGYDSVVKIDKLEPGQEIVKEVKGSVEKIDSTQTDPGKSPGTGDRVSTVFFLLTATISAITAVVYIKKKKRNIAGIFMGVMIFSLAGLTVPAIASADVVNADFTVEKTVKIDGKDSVIRAKVTYQYEGSTEDVTTSGNDNDNNNNDNNNNDNNGDNTGATVNHVTVHDPSIVKDPKTGTYYIFGTHMGWAKSTDLVNWTPFTNNINRNHVTIFAEAAKWAKKGNANYDIPGNLWAPDVIWNKDMQKWCMYMSVNGEHWYSSIVLLTADSLDGDWTYVGPVVYSGFTNEQETAETDFAKVTGSNTLPARYLENRNGNRTYGMNAIDPCVFYDEEGTLWMSYGSWFGGIYMLKLDEKTGLRDYEYKYETVANESDEYQGLKLGGGNHVSGEASYIEHIGNYYYLFITNGGLTANGGYNMRVFRSEHVTGPYTDPSGNDARYSAGNTGAGNVSGSVGVRLMSYYKWSHMDYGYCAQGHNSAFVDDDGKAYVIYHTRFDNQGEAHQVRVHQLFETKDGWLIAAPYEYTGETLPEKGYTDEQVIGTYEVLVHRSNIDFANKECVTGQIISLNDDGTVSGAMNGSWTKEDGTPYVSILLDGVEYNGVFVEQIKEETKEKVMTFTLLGSNELAVWGSKLEENDEQMLKDDIRTFTLPASVMDDITLKTAGFYGSKITYQSDKPEVLSNDGKVTRGETNTTVTMTVTFTHGSAVESKDYQITVIGTGSVDGKILVGEYFTDNPHNLSEPVTVPNPFNKNITAGLEIYKGVSIEFDIKGTGGVTSNILSFNNDVKVQGNCLCFTGGSYLGYNADGGFFDANRNADWTMATDYIKGEARIRIDITGSGFEVYANNQLAYSNKTLDSSVLITSADFKGYSVVLPWLNEKAAELSFGTGNWWFDQPDGKFNGTISNVKLYANEINEPVNQWTYNNYNSGSSYYEEGMKVFANDKSSGSRGVNTTFKDAYKFTDSYKMELDFAMTTGFAGSKGSNNEFVITGEGISYLDKNVNYGAAANYILKLSTGSVTADTETYYVNDSSQTVKIPKGKTVHLEMIVDAEGDVQAVFTVDGVSTTVNTHVNGSAKLEGVYLLIGRGTGTAKIGNISVSPDNTDVSGPEEEDTVPQVTVNVTGVAYPDKDSNITVTFTGDKELSENYPVKINGTQISKNLKVDMITVNSILYSGNTCTVELTMKAVSGWHSVNGSYDIEIVSGPSVLAKENISYALNISEDTEYTSIKTVNENQYLDGYYKIEGTKMYIMTIVRSDKIHCDGVLAGDVSYGWWNGICSELYCHMNGIKYSLGSHIYNGQYANPITWGEGVDSRLIASENVVRSYMALGTFDNDTDTDQGAILLNVVDLADIGLTVNDITGKEVTFSGFFGPNDGGIRFEEIDSKATYTLQ